MPRSRRPRRTPGCFSSTGATPIDGGRWGAHHGLDVPFIFDNVAARAGHGRHRRRRAGGWPTQMSEHVPRVRAHRAGPTRRGLPAWPVYDLDAARDDGVRPRRPGSSTIRAATNAACSHRCRMSSLARKLASLAAVAAGRRWRRAAPRRAPAAADRAQQILDDDEARDHVHGREGQHQRRLRLDVPARSVAALGRDGSARRR